MFHRVFHQVLTTFFTELFTGVFMEPFEIVFGGCSACISLPSSVASGPYPAPALDEESMGFNSDISVTRAVICR